MGNCAFFQNTSALCQDQSTLQVQKRDSVSIKELNKNQSTSESNVLLRYKLVRHRSLFRSKTNNKITHLKYYLVSPQVEI